MFCFGSRNRSVSVVYVGGSDAMEFIFSTVDRLFDKTLLET
jgi:hypothetical protein